LIEQGNKLYDSNKHEGKVTVKESYARCAQTGWNYLATTRIGFACRLALDFFDIEFISWLASTNGIDTAMVAESLILGMDMKFETSGETTYSENFLLIP